MVGPDSGSVTLCCPSFRLAKEAEFPRSPTHDPQPCPITARCCMPPTPFFNGIPAAALSSSSRLLSNLAACNMRSIDSERLLATGGRRETGTGVPPSVAGDEVGAGPITEVGRGATSRPDSMCECTTAGGDALGEVILACVVEHG